MAILKLSSEQKVILQDASYNGNYSKCDTTLIYTLIRNLTKVNPPSRGWGKHPTAPSMTTAGDDVERIREIRNIVYGHAPSAKLSQIEWSNFLVKVTDVLQRMDKRFPGKIFRKNSPQNAKYICSNILQYIVKLHCKMITHIIKLKKP